MRPKDSSVTHFASKSDRGSADILETIYSSSKALVKRAATTQKGAKFRALLSHHKGLLESNIKRYYTMVQKNNMAELLDLNPEKGLRRTSPHLRGKVANSQVTEPKTGGGDNSHSHRRRDAMPITISLNTSYMCKLLLIWDINQGLRENVGFAILNT